MKIKSMLLLILAFAMVFTLCACGGNEATGSNDSTQTSGTEASTQASTDATEDSSKVTYTVTVLDEGGNPVVGAFVQLCLDACIPSATNAEGVATYNVEEADYKVSFVSMPEGYSSDATEFYFENGSHEMTITLKAVA